MAKALRYLNVGLAIIFLFAMCFSRSLFAKNISVEDIRDFGAVIYFINDDYYKEVDLKECTQKILQGGISKCTDEYSRFLNIKENKKHNNEMVGRIFGIGVRIKYNKDSKINKFVILSVVKDSPAEKAGLEKDDIIVAVSSDGIKEHMFLVDDVDFFGVVDSIQGDKGTKVFLIVKRQGKLVEFYVIRDEIKLEIVSYKLLKEKIGYVKINEFAGDLKNDFDVAVSSLEKRGIEALVLDLRDNPGGLLSLAVEIADFFSKESHSLIVEVKGKNYANSSKYRGAIWKYGKFNKLKLTVLVDKGSASASELVTAYLKYQCGGKVIGKNTFGKGVVQSHLPVFDDGVLILTTGEYFVGDSHVAVDKVGIAPDYEIDNSAEVEKEENDLQLMKAMEVAEELLKKY